MREKHNNNMIRRIVDVCMTVLLLYLMAYQVTGEVLHEWTGIAMIVDECSCCSVPVRYGACVTRQKDASGYVALVICADGTPSWSSYTGDDGENEDRRQNQNSY